MVRLSALRSPRLARGNKTAQPAPPTTGQAERGYIAMMTSPAPQTPPRHWAFRLLRMLAILLAVLVLLPYLVTPLYRVVNPVSTLMLGRWLTGARVERSSVPIER